jgi:hypothetical protein
MANLGQNPLWDDMKSGNKNTTESVMGPSYSYADNIQGPAAMGVSSKGTFSQIGTNTGAITNYIKYMISGPALGNQFFVNTGGTCTAPDQSVQTRSNYINNVANGANALPAAMKQDLGGIASNFDGLLPGMLEDLEGLNPLHLIGSLAADSEPSCECYTCQTSGGPQSKFLNVDMTPDFDPELCQKVDTSVCVKSTEGFTDGTPIIFGLIFVGILIALNYQRK